MSKSGRESAYTPAFRTWPSTMKVNARPSSTVTATFGSRITGFSFVSITATSSLCVSPDASTDPTIGSSTLPD